MRSLTQRVNRGPRAFQDRVLRKVVGHKRDEITGG